jgi:hypothetical protein
VVPVCLLAADGDPLDTVKDAFADKPFASKCFYKRFDGQVHGFMAARGDFDKPAVAQAAGEGIQCLVDFYNNVMPSKA